MTTTYCEEIKNNLIVVGIFNLVIPYKIKNI